MTERHNQTSFGLTRAALFVPRLKNIFREEGVPEELVWIALIESSFRPFARSKSDAVGLFQFKKGTAEAFGLKVNTSRDERTYPFLSAKSSAKYLKYLFKRFQDWDLVLAAYNLGEGALFRTMERTGTKKWIQVKVYLRRETRDYVPKVHAAARIGEAFLEKGLHNMCFLYSVNKGDTLFAVAKRHQTDVTEIKRLNGLTNNTLQIGHTLIIPQVKK